MSPDTPGTLPPSPSSAPTPGSMTTPHALSDLRTPDVCVCVCVWEGGGYSLLARTIYVQQIYSTTAINSGCVISLKAVEATGLRGCGH